MIVLPFSPKYLYSIIRLCVPSYSKGVSNTCPFHPGAVQSIDSVSVDQTLTGVKPV